MDISKIDKNFAITTKIDEPDIKFISALESPIKTYGLMREDGEYARIPMSLAVKVNDGVKGYARSTTGGRVKFKTDSPYVAIKVKMSYVDKYDFITMTNTCGFDMYVDIGKGSEYHSTFVPPVTIVDGFEDIKRFGSAKMREITVNFPIYSHVSDLYIGLEENSRLEAPDNYKYEKPIVFYGSSIVHGTCASRPGTTYTSIVSRVLDSNFINLGFGGSAKGEAIFAEYIANLDMSVFVLDYDYNTPTVEHIKKTHKNFFEIIRKKNPTLPIVIMTRPISDLSDFAKRTRAVIKETYDSAIAKGDKNVYFIDGETFYDQKNHNDETVDLIHPTDLGYYKMAKKIIPILKGILEGQN